MAQDVIQEQAEDLLLADVFDRHMLAWLSP